MKKAADTILDCLKEKNISQRKLADFMGEDVRHLNQQLNRAGDMKVERFVNVLEHIGYRIEIVENDGIRKVSPQYAKEIVESREPRGLFWLHENGCFVGIDNTTGDAWTEHFSNKEECFKYLKDEECIDAEGRILNA